MPDVGESSCTTGVSSEAKLVVDLRFSTVLDGLGDPREGLADETEAASDCGFDSGFASCLSGFFTLAFCISAGVRSAGCRPCSASCSTMTCSCEEISMWLYNRTIIFCAHILVASTAMSSIFLEPFVLGNDSIPLTIWNMDNLTTPT